jgi:GDP-mannose 6-dehydrogenase
VPHLGALIRSDLEEVVNASDLLVLGLNDRKVLDDLASIAKTGQTLIDLVGLPPGRTFKAEVVGMCW